MKCPACENELSEMTVTGINVHVCRDSCGGLWFHLSQVKKIGRVKRGSGATLLSVEKVEGVKTYRGAEHPCPYCKTTLLYRHFFSRKFDTEVNQCAKCSGFWIDAAGLARIMESPQEQKNELLEKYFTVIMKEKISGMNMASQDMAQAAEMITAIFRFLRPDF
jgi:Zn-finger nucleic acid-binding protein